MEEHKLTLSKLVYKEIEKIPAGEVFDSSKFNIVYSQKPAFNKIIYALTSKGVIVRLTKGKFFKPFEGSEISQLTYENKVIIALTIKEKMLVGYLTGPYLYHRWKLTDNKTNVIHIAINGTLPERKIHSFKIKYRMQRILITKENIRQLKILDAIKEINRIPGTTSDRVLKILIERISRLNNQEKWKLLLLSQKYNIGTRMLLGAIFDYYFIEFDVELLRLELTPFTRFKLGISDTVLPNKQKWKIV